MPHITKRAQRLFLFLVLTIGLVFFIVATASYARRWLRTTRPLEPFQTASSDIDFSAITSCDAASSCERTSVGTGSNASQVYICNGSDAEDKALKILKCQEDYSISLLPTAPAPYLNLTDGVCYVVYNTKIQGDSYYVCYERPPPLTYNPGTQETNYNRPEDNGDPVPYTLMNELPLACGLYGTNMTMIGKSYMSTLGNYQYVSSSLGILTNVYTDINGIYSSNCNKTGLTTIQQAACQALNEFGNANGDTNISSLTGIRDALSNGATNMSNLYTTTLRPAYTGMNCAQPSIKMPF